MSLPKISSRILLIIFLVFSNFWIYRIFKANFLIGLILVFCSILISLFGEKKHSFKILFVCTLVLLIFQYKTTEPQSLTLLDNDGQRVQSERIQSYPLTYLDLYFKVIWFKPEKWIEQNDSVIALSRIEQNLFENLSLNKFFFGGFPRNNYSDFEKFTFFLIPAFILGIYKMIKDKNYKTLLLLFMVPVFTMSIIGNKNSLGPIVLFPFFIASFIAGIKFMQTNFKNSKIFYSTLIILILLGFILQISYDKV